MNAQDIKRSGTAKSIIASISTLVALYLGMWSLGIAPVTNGHVQTMLHDAFQEQSDSFAAQNKQIAMLENNQQRLITLVDDIKDELAITRQTQRNIMNILIQMQHDIGQRPKFPDENVK